MPTASSLTALASQAASKVNTAVGPAVATAYRCVLQRYTDSAVSFETQSIASATGTHHIKIDRIADMVGGLFIQVDLPGLVNRQISDGHEAILTGEEGKVAEGVVADVPYYVSQPGLAMIQGADLRIGSTVVDSTTREFTWVWQELTQASSTAAKLNRFDYGDDTLKAQKRSRYHQRVLVPIPVFTQKLCKALPLVGLPYHDVEVVVAFDNAAFGSSGIIQNFNPTGFTTCVRKGQESTTKMGGALAIGTAAAASTAQVGHADVTVALRYEAIYLADDEREKVSKASYNIEYFQFSQVHSMTGPHDGKVTVREDLNTSNGVVALYAVVRKEGAGLFDFAGASCPVSSIQRPAITQMSLILNNSWEQYETSTADNVQLLLKNDQVMNRDYDPEKIAVLAFAPHNAQQYMGHINFSRIDHKELQISVDHSLTSEKYEIFVFQRAWNILTIKAGVAGPMFAQ